ncbi:MAG: glycosyltransferase family 39 protein [Myxococcales bacterium]|nr:glycosyltransferase family 39 protein [Myxococcales bacterium]
MRVDDRESPGEPAQDRASVLFRRQRALGIGLAVLGGAGTFLVMSNDGRLAGGVLLGALGVFLMAWGVLGALGLWRPADGDTTAEPLPWIGPYPGEALWQSPLVTLPVALLVVVLGGFLLGYTYAPYLVLAMLVLLALSALRRPGLGLFVVVSAIYLPLLGTYGLWDPWETHYGEVVREILVRDDWISLWWAQDHWFWSKPILIFWTEALSVGAFGVDVAPDANPENIEWALRLPVFTMGMVALLATFATLRRIYSTRAALLSALVLATMPYFFFLTHQAITDIPFVANMAVAMAFLAAAVSEDPERPVRHYRIGPFVLSMQHVMVGMLLVFVLPQVFYLATRNVTMVEPFRFAWHGDTFLFGSAGNGGVPGNPDLGDRTPALSGWAAQPLAQAIYWSLGLGVLVALHRRERRRQALLMTGFYVFCALSFMGKGIPGFALPGLVALLFLIVTRRWELLTAGHLYVGRGILTVMTVGMPWYVAMYMRHGPKFTDRLLIHDHLNRLASGVHGDKGSIEYFLEQMGYGMFPWVALLPVALFLLVAYRNEGRGTKVRSESERDTLLLFTLWFFAAFTLFSSMVTKFHHYIFPAVPAAAVLIGLLFDRFLAVPQGGREVEQPGRVPLFLRRPRRLAGVLASLLFPVPLILAIGGMYGDLRGIVPESVASEVRADWVMQQGISTTTFAVLLLAAVGFLVVALVAFRRYPIVRDGRLSVAAIASVAVLGLVGRDLSWATDSRPEGFERLMQLFVYNYQRPWPDYLDYRPILTGMAITATILLLALALPRLRRMAALGLLGFALTFSAWTLNVYMRDLSPHWGQRELVKLYYEKRTGPEEPLLAFQMNWKGENLYTGNRVHVFVKLDNKAIKKWIRENPGKRVFILLEHSRLHSIRSLLAGGEHKELTTKRDQNKFVLVEARLPTTS